MSYDCDEPHAHSNRTSRADLRNRLAQDPYRTNGASPEGIRALQILHRRIDDFMHLIHPRPYWLKHSVPCSWLSSPASNWDVRSGLETSGRIE